MDLEVVTVGDELLLGHTTDTNAAEISRSLSEIGLRVVRRATVGDSPEGIAGAIAEAINRVDLVVVTGGLGPTGDDITKKSVADFFGLPLDLDEEYLGVLEERFASLGRSPILLRSSSLRLSRASCGI
jgi:nicotinamide-nucleotide amidase